MKCYGCGRIIKKEIKLDDFFKFNFYCDNCQKELAIKSIVFPLDDGYMGTLYYIFDEGVSVKLSSEKIKEIFMLIVNILKIKMSLKVLLKVSMLILNKIS